MHPYSRLDLADRTLAWLDEGRGSPIVFLHAFPLNATMWRPQIEHLPAGWRGVAPDVRGFQHAWREGAAPARHVRDHAQDVVALIDHLAVAPAVIVGLSMGGYIAFECWRQRPDAIAGLVLVDTRAEPDTDEARAKRRQMQDLVRTEGTSAVADVMLPSLLGPTTQTTDPHRAVEVRRLIEANRVDAISDALESLASRPDSRPTLAGISCPTLVVVGDEDALTPLPMAQTMASGIPGATLVVLPRAGHLSSVEQPAAFDAALHGWLDATFPDGPMRPGQVQ